MTATDFTPTQLETALVSAIRHDHKAVPPLLAELHRVDPHKADHWVAAIKRKAQACQH